jgi:hypothetical protein
VLLGRKRLHYDRQPAALDQHNEAVIEIRRRPRVVSDQAHAKPSIATKSPNKEHNRRMKSPDSKYHMDAPAFSEHHGREWPTNKTTDIYLSAINLQRSPFNTSDMRLFPRSMEASGGLQKRC